MRAVFVKDEEAASEGIRSGEEIEVMESEYGKNELLIDFLKDLGVWDVITGMKTKKRGNGVPDGLLGGCLILYNLARLGALEKADPVLRDGLLMTKVGFNLKKVKEAQAKDKGLVHRDTLRNHSKRMDIEESKRAFYEHVKVLRKKRLVRGKVFVADGFKIAVYGDTYEGSGRVFDPDANRFVKGYKVVLLMNVTEEREVVCGAAVGPINSDERDLLRVILDDLKRFGIPPKELMDLLVLDRGYWGAGFLEELSSSYGVDYLVLAPKNTGFHREVTEAVHSGYRIPMKADLKKSDTLRCTAAAMINDVELTDHTGRTLGKSNAVYCEAEERTGDRTEKKEYVFATSHTGHKALTYISLYWRRWAVENKGIRHLNQTWNVKRPVGRSLNAIVAQISISLMLSNAVRIFEVKHPKEKEATRELMKRRGQKSYLLDRGTIVFLPKKRIYAVMSSVRFAELVKERALNKLKLLLDAGLEPDSAIAEVKKGL